MRKLTFILLAGTLLLAAVVTGCQVAPKSDQDGSNPSLSNDSVSAPKGIYEFATVFKESEPEGRPATVWYPAYIPEGFSYDSLTVEYSNPGELKFPVCEAVFSTARKKSILLRAVRSCETMRLRQAKQSHGVARRRG